MPSKYINNISKQLRKIERTSGKGFIKRKKLELLLLERRILGHEQAYATRMYKRDWPKHNLSQKRRLVFKRSAEQKKNQIRYIDGLIKGLFAGK
ncbi:MAG: hypothetical protein HYW05_01480 [Candidatus Diapherotrites archaeon]|nr:hypothetical protein [Candidatus Diapherotrites archaeon]